MKAHTEMMIKGAIVSILNKSLATQGLGQIVRVVDTSKDHELATLMYVDGSIGYIQTDKLLPDVPENQLVVSMEEAMRRNREELMSYIRQLFGMAWEPEGATA